MTDLVVTQPFEDYKRGDRITDAAKVKEIEEGEYSRFVVRAADIPPPPPPAAAPNRAQVDPGKADVAVTGVEPTQQITPEPVVEHDVPQPAAKAVQPVAGPAVSVTREPGPTPLSAS